MTLLTLSLYQCSNVEHRSAPLSCVHSYIVLQYETVFKYITDTVPIIVYRDLICRASIYRVSVYRVSINRGLFCCADRISNTTKYYMIKYKLAGHGKMACRDSFMTKKTACRDLTKGIQCTWLHFDKTTFKDVCYLSFNGRLDNGWRRAPDIISILPVIFYLILKRYRNVTFTILSQISYLEIL